MNEKTANEIKILVIAMCIGLAVLLEAWSSAAFVFSYALLRLIWLSAWEQNNATN